MAAQHAFEVGAVVHGFASGSFGRDSYACRQVEAVGRDWIVTRNQRGEVELSAGERLPSPEEAAGRAWCSDACEGPELHDEMPGRHVTDCCCLVSDGAVLNFDLRCEFP